MTSLDEQQQKCIASEATLQERIDANKVHFLERIVESEVNAAAQIATNEAKFLERLAVLEQRLDKEANFKEGRFAALTSDLTKRHSLRRGLYRP